MVNKKITELTELTTPVSADVLAIVDDPAGSPVTKKITYGNVESNISHTNITAGDGSDHADVASNTTHRGLTNDPHSVTKSQVGLANVPNTDFSSPVNSNTIHRGTDGTADHSVVSSNKSHVDGD